MVPIDSQEADLGRMAELKTRRVLVVGDNPPTREVLRTVLFAAGMRSLAVATTPSEALERLAPNAFDVALIDCSHVDERWLMLVRRLRATPASRSLPVLMLAGRQETAGLQAAREAGVDGVMMKPVAPGALRRRLAALFRARSYVMLEGFPA